MPKKVVKGSGITARTVVVYEGEEVYENLTRSSERPPSAGDTFDDAVADIERWARTVLERARAESRRFDRDDDSPESYAFRAIEHIGIVRSCIKRRDVSNAASFAFALGDLLGEGRLKFRVEPAALTGEKFIKGRKPGSGGPIRKAIERTLGNHHALNNDGLWKALSANPPRGWIFRDNRLGRYIEGPKGSDGMDYARFRNVASQERAKLKG